MLSSDGALIDEYAIEEAFSSLAAYSMLSWRVDQAAYTMQKLVHAWGHDRLEVEQRQEWCLAALDLLRQAVLNHQGNLSMETRMVPHVMAHAVVISQACGLTYQMTDRDQELLGEMGHLLRRLGLWNYEHDIRENLYQMVESVFGQEHPGTLTSLIDLALVLRHQGKYKQAEEMNQRALTGLEKALGVDHPDVLTSVSNLASVLQYQGKYEQAEEMNRRALTGREKVLGVDHPSTLQYPEIDYRHTQISLAF